MKKYLTKKMEKMEKIRSNKKLQIEKAKNGDQIAFTYLWNFYWKGVYGFMLKRTNNEAFSKDITDETLSRALIKIKTYNEEYEFNTWLIAIAKNVHYSLNKRKAAMFLEISDRDCYIAGTTPSPEDELIIMENYLWLLKSLEQLRPHSQEVLLLRAEGMSYNEIVAKTGYSLDNVKVKLNRAKKEFASLIQK